MIGWFSYLEVLWYVDLGEFWRLISCLHWFGLVVMDCRNLNQVVLDWLADLEGLMDGFG